MIGYQSFLLADANILAPIGTTIGRVGIGVHGIPRCSDREAVVTHADRAPTRWPLVRESERKRKMAATRRLRSSENNLNDVSEPIIPKWYYPGRELFAVE